MWLPRSLLPPALVWLGGSKGRTVAGRQQGCDIGDRSAHCTGYFRGQAHPHFFSCFSFAPHPADSSMQRFSLQFAVFLVFPTHPLHIPSRIDRGELPGVAVWAPAPPSSTEMLAGRRHRVVRAPAPPSSTGIPANHIESIDQILGVLTLFQYLKSF